ncbi:MAG: T9SS type A sorting domain-containing protein [Ignavibacteria bacterium]|nr:T9SS type A sorting domain-containing protein [Ignavibacteria bacterium]MBT8381554.1 T9SS type A sorting domain-containing protein [Ignavibacteria bacterium]MBT8390737.1 T9SS type A sorting domain-containing protein [Ignavibacteria bacterium]NNJ53498.1 T9SS type A sorting domain-containing protein [Ignavibacteriaceae bacterium]NNL20956.1 T9SS type A sorting domain-containing protein [Ignavibacteriaceae bacterium]
MLHKFTALVVILLLFGFGFTQAQDYSKITKPDVVITGEETPDISNLPVVENSSVITFDNVVSANGLVWDVSNITDRKTGYDLQSNASTQQVWVDPNNPDFVHAIFTNSQESATWADRTCLYFGSTDGGANWFEFGGVPVNTGTDGRSGFPAIHGLSTGEAVIANHNNASGTPTRTKIFVDNSPFEYNFSENDPGMAGSEGEAIWPRLTVNNDNIVFASSQNGPDSFFVNTHDLSAFGGWQPFDGEQAEQYAFAVSDGGKVGMAYNGQPPAADGDVFYVESTDNGLTWTAPLKIFDRPDAQDTSMGAIRGVTVTFYGEEPCVSYEICQQIWSGGNYFPGLPSEIHFWSPNINGGNPKVVADSNNVPYYPYLGTNDVQVPVCRPVLARSEMHDFILLAFDATTENYQPSADTTSYCAGYFMYSTDGGENFTDPEMFTPVGTPIMDFRYPSITPINPVSTTDEDVVNVHIVMQGDTIAGSTVNAAGQPVGVTAQYYHFKTQLVVENTGQDPLVVNEFNLEQNYPNPFNPSTSINYTLAERSNVSLRVYDVLGNEVVTLVNTSQDAGSHTINFDASSLASGLYIYTLNAGSFTSSKKMMLLK